MYSNWNQLVMAWNSRTWLCWLHADCAGVHETRTHFYAHRWRLSPDRHCKTWQNTLPASGPKRPPGPRCLDTLQASSPSLAKLSSPAPLKLLPLKFFVKSHRTIHFIPLPTKSSHLISKIQPTTNFSNAANLSNVQITLSHTNSMKESNSNTIIALNGITKTKWEIEQNILLKQLIHFTYCRSKGQLTLCLTELHSSKCGKETPRHRT